jgi:hypothetical protein
MTMSEDKTKWEIIAQLFEVSNVKSSCKVEGDSGGQFSLWLRYVSSPVEMRQI